MVAGADETAVGPMVIVAVDQYEPEPLVPDPVAVRMLPRAAAVTVKLAAWRPFRRLMRSATEKKIPGIWMSMLCRKRYIDDAVVDAVRDGIDTVVVLGAGFDTRAYRVPELADTTVFEVDLPANIDRKKAKLRALQGGTPDNVTLVAVDFETQDLAGALRDHGYRGGRTMFVWEAVTQYLTEDGVRKTFDFLATAAPGSRLVFTFVRKDFLDGTALRGAESAYREFVTKRKLWRFGMDPGEVGDFLAGYHWTETEQMGPAEFADRYSDAIAHARPASEIERTVHAEKATTDG